MKNLYKLLIVCVLLVGFTSCDETESPTIDPNTVQSIAYFNSTVQTLPVSDSGESVAEIIVGASDLSSSDRSISVSIDASSTADPSEYTIDQSSLVIPAGEHIATVRVIGNFNAIPETGTTNVVINLDSVDGARLDGDQLSHRVNLFRFCPFTNGSTFLGDYELSTVTTGIFGVETFIAGTVTLTQGATVADRQFSSGLYAAFGGFGPYTWNFSLICGDVVVPGSVSTGVGCGGNIQIGPGNTNATYDGSDDSELLINYTDDVDGGGGCGGPVQIQIRLTKL